jgi:transcriptional antiterminator RfaH
VCAPVHTTIPGMSVDSKQAGQAWFIVRAKPKREAYAKSNLELRELTVFLPRIMELDYGETDVSKRAPAPLFPGYLFVRMYLDLDYYRVIWTPGVRDIVSLGNGPVPVPEQVVDEVRARCDASGVVCVQPAPWRSGDRVQIPQGPFAGLLATVVTVMSSRRRVRLLIDFLARQTCVEMPLFSLRSPSTAGTAARCSEVARRQWRR